MSHAKLDKLSVMGIRSFDNQTASVIKFGSPLTLIVGTNGSGKTTIIESLKYLTTGYLPPNSRGGAFIHDPKLCGEKEVLAVAKVSFQNTQDKKMVCSRRLQLTVKKTSRQMKSLEANLVLYANGERTAISSRVAELDQMLPMYLGVSKSILDNVIFCHQDESLWPMSEPSVLKKKFDEIFEAMKYTKAIDNIKVLRKKYNEDLKTLKMAESHAKDEKLNGERSEKQQRQLDNEIQALREQSQELQRQIKDAEEKYGYAQDTAASFNQIISTLDGKRIEAKAKLDSLKELEEHIEIMEDTDDELLSMREKYQDRVAHFSEDLEAKKEVYKDLDQQIGEGREKIERKGEERGQLAEAGRQYEMKLRQREEMVKSSARTHGIRGFDEELDADHVTSFMDRIAKMAKDQKSALDRAQKQSREEMSEVGVALNDLSLRKHTLQRDMQTTKEYVNDNDSKSKQLREKAKAADVDEGRQAVLESNVEDIESKLSKARKSSEQQNFDKQIADTYAKVQSFDHTLEQLQADLFQATKHNQEAARLDILKEDLKRAKLGLQKMEGAHKEHLNKLVGSSWSSDDLPRLFSDTQASKASQLQQAEKQRDGTFQELQQISSKLKTTRDDLKEKQKEHDKSLKVVQDACQENEDPSQFEDILKEMEDEFEALCGDDSKFAALEDYYKKCQGVLQARNMCQLCSRGFNTESEKTAIRKKIEENLKKAQEELKKQNRADAEKELMNARQVIKPAYDKWVRLRDEEIPLLRKEVDRLNPKHEEMSRRIDREDIEVQQLQSAKADLDSWAETVRKMSDHVSSIARYEEDLQGLTQKQSQSGLSKTVNELQTLIREENDHRRSAESTLSGLRDDRERSQSTINGLEISLRDERSKLSNVVQQLKEKSAVKEQLEDLKRHADSLRSKMTDLDREYADLQPEIEQAQLKLDDVTKRGRMREDDLRKTLDELQSTLNSLQNTEREIQSYAEENISSQLQSCDRAMQSLRSEQTRLQKEMKTLTSEINKLKEEETRHGETERQINQNLRYRTNLRSLEQSRKEIEELESHNAESDRQHWDREASKHQARRNKLTADNAGVFGEVKSKDQELQRLMEEWETLYKGAAARYREATIKVTATEYAVKDLGAYATALDHAIMRYHALKMNEINDIVDDLWRRTYQGTDVDTVLIRSDSEGQQRAGNKSYNYRVCMVKQDAEMDMRGRCSAGQKVLTSIIIRLALAECFGTNCGVMALDEPTTNLDRDNIRALATSLNSIIKSRAANQKNFQLIVITHDEEFLRDMRASDFVDDYWRVSRNERQKSRIDMQKLTAVF